jgi:hypothetical protein
MGGDDWGPEPRVGRALRGGDSCGMQRPWTGGLAELARSDWIGSQFSGPTSKASWPSAESADCLTDLPRVFAIFPGTRLRMAKRPCIIVFTFITTFHLNSSWSCEGMAEHTSASGSRWKAWLPGTTTVQEPLASGGSPYSTVRDLYLLTAFLLGLKESLYQKLIRLWKPRGGSQISPGAEVSVSFANLPFPCIVSSNKVHMWSSSSECTEILCHSYETHLKVNITFCICWVSFMPQAVHFGESVSYIWKLIKLLIRSEHINSFCPSHTMSS